jgi:sporulation protein YlmC with PRC-barrel domain
MNLLVAIPLATVLGCAVGPSWGCDGAPPITAASVHVAQAETAVRPADAPKVADAAPQEESLEEKFEKRFPQKVRVGDLIGLPVLDDDDVTLGHVEEVVRDPQGKTKLIVSYSRWFGWFGRPVAVPIEAVAILARQIASLEMQPPEYANAPTWMPGADQRLPDSDTIRIALTRR